MTTIQVTCDSCGSPFDVDARKAGQSVPCPKCHNRASVPDVITAQPLVTQVAPVSAPVARLSVGSPSTAAVPFSRRAMQLFVALPRPAQLAAVGLLGLAVGYFIGWIRTVWVRYSPAVYQQQVMRAEKAERDLSTLAQQQKELETLAARGKVNAESSAKEVVRIRKLMNELRAEKDVPEWASKEKWAEAQAEIARLKTAEEENARLKAENAKTRARLDKADAERKSLLAKLAAAEKAQRSDSPSTRPQRPPTDAEEKGGAEIAAETFVKRKLAHPSTAKFPFFGQNAKKNDDGTWTVTGTVKAKNSFNLETTMNYACQVKHEGDSWILVDCLIAESDE